MSMKTILQELVKLEERRVVRIRENLQKAIRKANQIQKAQKAEQNR